MFHGRKAFNKTSNRTVSPPVLLALALLWSGAESRIMSLFTKHRLFLLIVLPTGILCASFPEEIAIVIGKTGLFEGSTKNLGVLYLFLSIVILTIESKMNKQVQK